MDFLTADAVVLAFVRFLPSKKERGVDFSFLNFIVYCTSVFGTEVSGYLNL